LNPWDYTVIVVEDEPDEVFLLKQAFQRVGLKNPLLVLRDGQEAIDYLSRPGAASGPGVPPALMLLDLKMPRKTGFEVLEWLRRQPGLKRIVVVVMSSSNLMSDVNRAYELGCNSYLLKPGNVDQLAEMVKLINSYWLLLNRNPEVSHGPHTAPFL
jgi:CheY-like chemotaxis protein